ncbi:C-C motif chemokine 4, partial [Tauraco erythrolophus]
FCYQSSAAPSKYRSFAMGSDPPTFCCFSYTSRQVPRSFVVEYYKTNSLCSHPAVV